MSSSAHHSRCKVQRACPLISPNSLTLQSHPLHFEMLTNILNDSYVKTLDLDRSLSILAILAVLLTAPLLNSPALVQSVSVADLQLSGPHDIRLVAETSSRSPFSVSSPSLPFSRSRTMAEDQAFSATFLGQNCTPELLANPLIGRAILSIPASYQ